MSSLKERLYQLCVDHIKSLEVEIKNTISEVRDSAANETKSSAGDKYETAREMMQQEIDRNQARLNEVNKLKAILESITPGDTRDAALPGSVVYTNNGNFYIAISAGRLTADNTVFYAISASSPIGAKLTGQKAGYSFELNGKRFVIEKVV